MDKEYINSVARSVADNLNCTAEKIQADTDAESLIKHLGGVYGYVYAKINMLRAELELEKAFSGS